MGRQETVTFTCDWCGATATPPKTSYGSYVSPDDWSEIGCDDCGTMNALLCNLCDLARTQALLDVEARRRQSAGGDK